MNKKVLILTTAAVLTIGSATIAFAKGQNDNVFSCFSNTKSGAAAVQSSETNFLSVMPDIMEKNGFGNMADAMRNGDYKAMSDIMKRLSDDDYQKMIDIMKDNGYGGMSNMMQRIGKNGMIQMHNAMMGSGTNQGTKQGFGGMMSGYFQNQQ
ncbi:MAG: hypothetical protein Q8930_17870 [Bacillota bacterium]|nr:hypothetical protein [Bacillota bacterium]